MRISEICVQRPVFATVLSLVILLIGAVSYSRLTVREYPKIDEPVVTVQTRYPGASSEIIESQVTKILEDSIAGIEGVDVLTSISRAEDSQITVRFRLEIEPDAAASDVRDRVSRVRGKLPTGVEESVVAKVEADANPILWLIFSSDTRNALEISDIINRFVRPKLQTMPGAADVRIFGERKYAMRIWLDPDRLTSYKLTVQDVEDALRRQNVEIPSGRIESVQREFTVTSTTGLEKASQFEQIIVKQGPSTPTSPGYTVRLADVGRVAIGPRDDRVSARFNGSNAVSVGMIKQATANPLELASAVRNGLDGLRRDLPQGVSVDIGYDSTVFIDKSIEAVRTTIWEAIGLVAVVILLFLRSVRASIIPLVTIPVSLIGAFGLMFAMGFSINTLTLLSLVLAIGLVVDDAIVVLENIFRHIENGMEPKAAAIQGSKEIGFAVVAMTLTLAAVYAPVAFTTGRTGRLFVEFALTLAGAVLVSGFVALTLSPMMCAHMLRHQPSHGRLYNLIEAAFDALNRGYERSLALSLKVRWLVILVMLAVGGASVWLFQTTKSELSPMEDRGVVTSVFSAPEGSTLAYTESQAMRIEKFSEKYPEVERLQGVIGNPTVTQGVMFYRLKDWSERTRTSMEIAKDLQPKVLGIPGLQAFVVTPPSLGQSFREQPINVVIVGTAPYEQMQMVANRLVTELNKNPGFVGVDTDLRLNKPELKVAVDRDRAADAGVQVETIGRTLETLLGGRAVTRFKKDSEQYDVMVQLERDERRAPDDISNLMMRGRNEQLIPLSALLDVQEGITPRELNHFGQRRAVSVRANLAPGYSQGEAIEFLEAAAATALPAGFQLDYNGQTREFKQSQSTLLITFGLALVFIFLVLAAQFESFVDPFIILLTVPLSMTGALAALQWSGGTLNVFSKIGLITLVGLITKHGILIVEFANQLQDQGYDRMQAVKEAAKLRLRPILMTTGAMVLGAIPLALARGAGAESRAQIGWVIVGGMTLGTILTLFVVPTVYSLLARKRHAQSAQVTGASLVPGQLGH